MANRADLEAEQRRYFDAYDAIRERLTRLPGVVEVGVGMKERGNQLTDQIAFRVYVEEKRPEHELGADQVVPREIDGFRTDVIKVRRRVKIIGFNDVDDVARYKPRVGGIRIQNDNQAGSGTLGCFCRRNDDSKVVLLSNHHVLFTPNEDDPTRWMPMKNKTRVAQPLYETYCCCSCNTVGTVLDGDNDLDCAIASLDDGVPYIPKVRQIKKPDNTLELNGFLSGAGAPVSGESVWKVGARTGLTRGHLGEVHPNLDLEMHPDGFPYFANHGDSGSVVVSLATGNVVGLLKSIDNEIDQGGTLGYGTQIQSVLDRLNITILATDPLQQYDVADSAEDVLARLAGAAPGSGLDAFARRLQATPRGTALLGLADEHWEECARLVNTCRPVTIAWHRSQGPSFMAALARSARVPEYRVPRQIEGVSRAQAAAALRAAFARHGSPRLQAALAADGDLLQEAFLRCDTVEDLVQAREASAASSGASGA